MIIVVLLALCAGRAAAEPELCAAAGKRRDAAMCAPAPSRCVRPGSVFWLYIRQCAGFSVGKGILDSLYLALRAFSRSAARSRSAWRECASLPRMLPSLSTQRFQSGSALAALALALMAALRTASSSPSSPAASRFACFFFGFRDALGRRLLRVFKVLKTLRRGLLGRLLLGRAARLELGLGPLASVFFLDA